MSPTLSADSAAVLSVLEEALTRQRPFGDTVRNEADGLNVVPSGGVMTNRSTASVLDGAARK